MFRVTELKSGDPALTTADLLLVVPGSTPRLLLYIANWCASCQLEHLITQSLKEGKWVIEIFYTTSFHETYLGTL